MKFLALAAMLLLFTGCFVASSSDNPYRTVPTTNNPHVIKQSPTAGGVRY